MKLSQRYFVLLALSFCVYYSFGQSPAPRKTVVERFLKYVKIDTQSKDDVDTIPSTRKQFNLAKVLVEELKELGLNDAHVDDHCYVYATLATNLPASVAAKVPVIGLISHMDTSPEVSGANVNAIVHYAYSGGDIRLPNDTSQVITVGKNPRRKDNLSTDIITADGTTLLGADDKAGCSEIMTAIQTLVNDPTIKHGAIKIAFTPDEEVGNGAHGFDVKGFGAQYAYTIDGGQTGEVSNETWNADEAKITIKGKNTHPGTAKGIMNNSLYPMAYFISLFPPGMKPETTEKRVGFLHPYSGTVEVEESKLKVLLRDFDMKGLERQRKILNDMKAKTLKKFPKAVIDIDIKETYRNMKLELDKVPFVTDYAIEACKRTGVKVDFKPVRGGTDGSQLTSTASLNGFPCAAWKKPSRQF